MKTYSRHDFAKPYCDLNHVHRALSNFDSFYSLSQVFFARLEFLLVFVKCSVSCRLLDHENITNSDEHMWLIPFNEGANHIVTVSFPEEILFTGIRIWNYNKSLEDTYRGVRTSL